MKRRTQLKLKQLRVIIFSWFMVGIFITLYDYLILKTHYSLGASEDYNFLFSLAMNLLASLIGSLLGGGLLVFYINVKYQDKPYGRTITAVSISYILIIALIIFTLGIITIPVKTGKIVFDTASLEIFRNFIFDTSRIKNVMIWSIVVALTQLFLQMNNKFGYGVFWNILRGKYNIPKEEARIFMSVDLNSSTSIAERLGDEKYHEFLKEFYADITNPILDNNAEIYQYVGDEIIIAWKQQNGIENNQCIECFFDMKQKLETNKEKYLKLFGLIPSFKAGIHLGKVIVGEIGIIKRDITYSGDVLNTIARIRNKCNEFGVELIVSEDLLANLYLPENYITKSLGAIKLRGKQKTILLSTLTPAV